MSKAEVSTRTVWIAWAAILLSDAIILGAALSRVLEVYPEAGPGWLGVFFAVWAVLAAAFSHNRWRKTSGVSLTFDTYINYIVAWSVDQSVSILGLGLTVFGTPWLIWIWFPLFGGALAIIHRPRPRSAA